ncbi:MAG: hypothetical protein WAM97_22370 [Acidimicrobiales bacterium]
MTRSELWIESYQGEVLGEAVFGTMAEWQQDPERRRQLEVLTLLERSTKELADPVFESGELERGDTAATLDAAGQLAAALREVSWEDFIGGILPLTEEFLVKYRELVQLADRVEERAIAEAYVEHELALAAYARRALGREPGDPLELVLALAHVKAALTPG